MEYILRSLGGDRSLPYSCYSVSSIRTFMHTAPCRNWVYLWSAFSLPLLPVVLEIPPSAPQPPFPVNFSSTSWLFQHFRRLCLSSIDIHFPASEIVTLPHTLFQENAGFRRIAL
jgi:hypothetical protein